MNRIKKHIQNLERWDKMCDEIIENGCDLLIEFEAQELKEYIEIQLEYYRDELKQHNR